MRLSVENSNNSTISERKFLTQIELCLPIHFSGEIDEWAHRAHAHATN